MKLSTMLQEKKRRRVRVTCSLLLLLLLLIAAECLHSRFGLMQTNYEITSGKLNEPIRIVQLTDLHSSRFGEGNSRLIGMVADAQPDLIFITGDLVNSHAGAVRAGSTADTGTADAATSGTAAATTSADPYGLNAATDLIRRLSAIAPVYLSLGNQEIELGDETEIDFSAAYGEAGAYVLERSYVDVTVKGQALRIGGIYGYCQPFAFSMESMREDEAAYLIDFQDTDACRLLLCHMPVCWVASYSLYDYDADFVFAGHAHGGQVRIPYLGGLWAPDQGFFPGEMCGVYTTSEQGWRVSREQILEYAEKMGYDDSYTGYYREHDSYTPSYLILSRGLGNTDWLPRFYNVPEIVVADLLPEA